jgi:hypothetical protein
MFMFGKGSFATIDIWLTVTGSIVDNGGMIMKQITTSFYVKSNMQRYSKKCDDRAVIALTAGGAESASACTVPANVVPGTCTA